MTLDNRHKIALPFWARPGIAAITDASTNGGGVGGDDDGDDDDDTDEDGDEDGDDDGDDLSVDDLRAELTRTRTALKRANDSAARKRTRLKEAKAAKPQAPAKGDDDKADLEAERARIRAEVQAEVQAERLESRVQVELSRAGVPANLADRAVRLLDLDDLELDGKTVEGLDDQIEQLREDFPGLFTDGKTGDGDDDDKPARRRRPGVAGRGDGERSVAPKSATERQAAYLRGS